MPWLIKKYAFLVRGDRELLVRKRQVGERWDIEYHWYGGKTGWYGADVWWKFTNSMESVESQVDSWYNTVDEAKKHPTISYAAIE